MVSPLYGHLYENILEATGTQTEGQGVVERERG